MKTEPNPIMPTGQSKADNGRVLVSLFVLLTAIDFVSIPPSISEVVDSATGMKRTIRVDGFEIAREEITQREYQAVIGANPSSHIGPNFPVENVSWFDAIRFANAFSIRQKTEPCYNPSTGERVRIKCKGYRLPTDAEWFRAFRLREDPTNLAAVNLGLDQTTDAAQLDKLATRAVDTASRGVRDLVGNVWEWCEDWFRPVASPWPLDNPTGALRGLTRVVRGGSFRTTRTSWSRSLRSSLDPNSRSPHTGFRLVRSTGQSLAFPAPSFDTWMPPQKTGQQQPSTAPEPNAPSIQPVTSKPSLAKWMAALGEPKGLSRQLPPKVRLVQNVQDPFFEAKIMDFESEPGIWERFAVIESPQRPAVPRPVVIVPYYDVDTPLGADLGGRGFNLMPSIWFARHAAQMGYVAVAVRWFGESDGERYDEAIANLRKRAPGLSGLGKWVWDSKRLIDHLVTLPGVDRSKIAVIGHSLGGKLALYSAATDPRVRAAVLSEPGVSLRFSNYGDYWYWGDNLKKLPPGSDQHELLGLIAPRPLLLIAGEDADGDKSWPVLEAVRGLYPQKSDLGWINHRAGHTPTLEAVGHALDWLRTKLE
jgi:pimeloyl-ACP methyl ester carboxylesterase